MAISLHAIDKPGLFYDEVLFDNAATARFDGNFIDRRMAGIPVTLMPYIGALKAYIYAPIFAIFKESALSVRLPMIVLVSCGLLLLLAALCELVNTAVALLVLVVLSFDNGIFWLTREDLGPLAPDLFFKCFAVFGVARFVRRRDARWVLVTVAALALGTFNKLDFIWTVNAFAAASLLVAWSHRRELRQYFRAAATWVAGLASSTPRSAAGTSVVTSAASTQGLRVGCSTTRG